MIKRFSKLTRTLVILIMSVLLVGTTRARAEGRGDFCIGVYVNGDSHPQNLPPSRMAADWAAHGITRAVLLTKQYMQLAPQGLNSLAKQWGIELYIGNIWAGTSEDERNMRMIINLVNSYPDSDAVKGWYAGDEVEMSQDPASDPTIEEKLRGFVAMIRELDPNRKVIVNHDARTQKWGGRFASLGEDESWCSVYWANHCAAGYLNKTMAVHHAAYGDAAIPLTFVYGAQSTNTFPAQQNATDAGLEGVTLEQLKATPTRADIADYIMTAHKLGASGASFYVYDGYYDWTFYTLVDARGRSVDGKMEGIRDAVDQIAARAGRPSLTLNVEHDDRSLDIRVKTEPGQRPVESVGVDISYDGGYTWQRVSDFEPQGGAMKYTIPCHPIQRPYWSMLRARCFDGSQYSLWSLWNVYPWHATRGSE